MSRIFKSKVFQLRFCELYGFSWLKNIAVVVLLLCGSVSGAVQIDFFYEPGCHDCERIEAEILPEV